MTKQRSSAKPDEREKFAFNLGDLVDSTGLAVRLRDSLDPVSRYLRDRLGPETQRHLDEYTGSGPPPVVLEQTLVEELTRLAQGPPLYDADGFMQVELNEQTRKLLDRGPPEADVLRLNVLLLEDAFPDELLRNYSRWPKLPAERVQTGVRMEKRMVKVLKALAEYSDVPMGELLEDIVLHAFEGVSTFDSRASRERISALKAVYGMDYDVHAGMRFVEKAPVR